MGELAWQLEKSYSTLYHPSNDKFLKRDITPEGTEKKKVSIRTEDLN